GEPCAWPGRAGAAAQRLLYGDRGRSMITAREVLSTLSEAAAEPWELTKEEMVAQRIAEIETQLKGLRALPVKKIQGNLTRRKDRSDLRIAKEAGDVLGKIQGLEQRITKLRSPEALAAVGPIHRDLVQKALT